MTTPITFANPTVTAEIEGRGYGQPEAAFSVAAKERGYTVRGSKYYDETGAQVPFLDRVEGALIFQGYRWIIQREGRWFVVREVKEAAA
jgi:hypothetical protein